MRLRKRKKKREYTFGDIVDAFSAGGRIDNVFYERPEWYTIEGTYFKEWYEDKFGEYP